MKTIIIFRDKGENTIPGDEPIIRFFLIFSWTKCSVQRRYVTFLEYLKAV